MNGSLIALRFAQFRDWLRFIPSWLSRAEIRRKYHWTGERHYIRNLGKAE